MNSFLILKYFTSYFNFKNYRSFFFCKKLITKKVKFRLRNFFFFFELRISNLLKKFGFVKRNFYLYNIKSSFLLFNKDKKFFLYVKNKNYIVKVGDLISLNYKYYGINRFYKYFYNSFIEVNYNIKSFNILRLPFINEILKR